MVEKQVYITDTVRNLTEKMMVRGEKIAIKPIQHDDGKKEVAIVIE